ncbi:MAG: agmatine deiminase family protein [Bacteroidales bacterium]|nr:agmatine deiminase family protein [Bacteroidales bacterium]
MSDQRRLPAEWEPQSYVQLTWPNVDTDWDYILDDTIACYTKIAHEIAKRQQLLIVARDKKEVMPHISDIDPDRYVIVELPINDTWARDHGFLTVFDNGEPVLLDFQFNGWGLKFASDKDNLINRGLFAQSALVKTKASYENHLSTVLEGGSIESDGHGTIMTTSECLLSPNRNGAHFREEIEQMLKEAFGAERILWVDHGYLAGDDTDSHIDTLARMAPGNTIMYVKCDDKSDEHYQQLNMMEYDLKKFVVADTGKPYNLVALPMCTPQFEPIDGHRLPATYANFLFINGAILVPIYNAPTDDAALEVFRKTFPDYEVVGIDCSPLIRQHGSLHCVTMQYPLRVKI